MEKVDIIFSILLDIKTYLGVTIRICSIPRRHGTWYAELAWSMGVLKGKRTLFVLILEVAWIAHLYHSWMEKTPTGMVTI